MAKKGGASRKTHLGSSRIEMAGSTHAGKVRDHNEDALLVSEQYGCMALADGMGGLSAGELASRSFIETLRESMEAGPISFSELFKRANDRIRALRSMPDVGEKIGSTAVVTYFSGTTAHVAWIGDSRAYILRDGKIACVTRDHSFVADLARLGVISEVEAKLHPERHVLTKALGIKDSAGNEFDVIQVELAAGDRILICSDGLHGFLGETEISAALAKAGNVAQATELLLELTLTTTEAADNITVACAEILVS